MQSTQYRIVNEFLHIIKNMISATTFGLLQTFALFGLAAGAILMPGQIKAEPDGQERNAFALHLFT